MIAAVSVVVIVLVKDAAIIYQCVFASTADIVFALSLSKKHLQCSWSKAILFLLPKKEGKSNVCRQTVKT